MTQEELSGVLHNHGLWLAHEGGQRAKLYGADLYGADLGEANLGGASLGDLRIIQLGPLGSRKDYLVVKQFTDGTTEAMTGCFRGTLEDLGRAVEQTHASHNPTFYAEYMAAITYCQTIFNLARKVPS